MAKYFYYTGLFLSLLFQVFLEFLFSSDIPIAINNHELNYFVIYSVLIIAVFLVLKKIPGVENKNISLITFSFVCLWLLISLKILDLVEVPPYLYIINLVGILTPLTLLLASLINRKRDL